MMLKLSHDTDATITEQLYFYHSATIAILIINKGKLRYMFEIGTKKVINIINSHITKDQRRLLHM